MSNLYIRVRTGFYSNRKTVRLRLKIGDDAFWIPPRLWAYCAENQADGDISGYQSEELAELIGCGKYATSILQALKDCGFVTNEGKIHDWAEHNGYHEKFAERAKFAASARWSKHRKNPPALPSDTESGNRKGESGDKHCLSNAPSITAEQIYKEYPLKVGKPKALKAIAKAMLKIEPSKLLEITIAFAKRRAGDRAYLAYPATWFNDERYNDDPSTWTRDESHSGTNGQRIDRSIGTSNEGIASQYANLGRLAKPENSQ